MNASHQWIVPLARPVIGEPEMEAVRDVLLSRWLTQGPVCQHFERELCNYLQAQNAVVVNSGTSALFLAVKALGITGEVILPSLTYVASANAIVAAGAVPVFADVDYTTCNLTPQTIYEMITSTTQAIMVVHFAGQLCDMPGIRELTRNLGIAVIEDSAETLGGKIGNTINGNWSDAACYSFFPTKNITTGEGGAVTTNDSILAAKIRALAAHGIEKDSSLSFQTKPWRRSASYPGYNFRLSDILAAIGLVQLTRVEDMNNQRRQNARKLASKLSAVSCIDLPIEMEDYYHVYQMFTIKIRSPAQRDMLVSYLRQRGIEASVHFDPPVHLQLPYYTGRALPVTEVLSSSLVTLPMYPELSDSEIDYIATNVKAAIAEQVKH